MTTSRETSRPGSGMTRRELNKTLAALGLGLVAAPMVPRAAAAAGK